MKKLLPLICCLFLLAATSKAQYVNIPDSNFRNFLMIQYPNCFNSAGEMDTILAANSNDTDVEFSGLWNIKNIDGIQYFKKIKRLSLRLGDVDSINYLPENINSLKLWHLSTLSYIAHFPNSIDSIDIYDIYYGIQNNPSFPSNLKFLSCDGGFNYMPNLPNSVETIWLSYNWIDTIKSLPSNLKQFFSYNNNIKKIVSFPNQLEDFESFNDSLETIPQMPATMKYLGCRQNMAFTQLPNLPISLKKLYVDGTGFTSLPLLPNSLIDLNISRTNLATLPLLPNGLRKLDYSWNKGYSYSVLPDSLRELNCSGNHLISSPPLPKMLSTLVCADNLLISLPTLHHLDSLTYINCQFNKLYTLPKLPKNVNMIFCGYNNLISLPSLPYSLRNLFLDSNNLTCIPYLPDSLENLSFDTAKIKCLTNLPYFISFYNYRVCNPTNNPNHCQSFPAVQSFAYTDLNNNNKFDANEFSKHNLKITLSNNNYAYTNTSGVAVINTDSIGIYSITAQAPPFYNAVPPSYTHNFSSYDTIIYDTFALQPTVLKDSIAIKLTPTNWAARAGRAYPYLMQYENVGTTVLSNVVASLQYDNNILVYDSSSITTTNNVSSISLNVGNLVPGQTGSFIAYFTVKTTAVLNTNFTSIAGIATNSVGATDTLQSTVRGSYDPNDKQATPTLTPQQVTDGKDIDYTIRFQNTGTDTAFNVVIADTLDSKLQTNQVQMIGSSHPCRTTVKDNIIFFEFFNIMLPDSNVNKLGSNGFVSFKIKPVSTVTNGTTIPNKAAIYFDYNSPVITKPANTIIQNPLPLQLLNFSAIAQNELSKILVYWNTANEVNTAYFIIETSNNGNNFKAVAEIAAKGIGSNSYFYSIDKANVVYVRLKMVDRNGLFSYSNVIKLASTVYLVDGLIVVKNPTKHQLKLNVISSKLNNTNANLVNAQGKVVKRFVLQQGYITIDIIGIAAGVYYLQSNEGSKKVVVE